MNNRFEGKTFDEMMEMLEHGNTNERATALALRYGMIDGVHHKQWLIDQMLRIVAGGGYAEIMEIYNGDESYADYAKWDTGIAP